MDTWETVTVTAERKDAARPSERETNGRRKESEILASVVEGVEVTRRKLDDETSVADDAENVTEKGRVAVATR